MKLFNWENSKKLFNKKIEEEIIPIHEESGNIIKDRTELSLDQQDQTIINEHLDLNDQGFEDQPTKEKKFITNENISDNFDWETYILDQIDTTFDKSEYEPDEIKTPRGIHRPDFINDIIRKYSLPNEEWQKLTSEQKEQRKKQAQTEIQEYYIKQPKKMVRKKNDKEMAT